MSSAVAQREGKRSLSPWLIAGGVLVLLAIPTGVALWLPRGLRIHNPLNLKQLGSWQSWLGLAPAQPDSEFVAFAPAAGNGWEDYWGLRAGARTVLNKQVRDNYLTIRQIITAYAPPSENDSDNYAETVADEIGMSPDAFINIAGDPNLHKQLVLAMVRVEQGYVPSSWPDDMVNQAVASSRQVS